MSLRRSVAIAALAALAWPCAAAAKSQADSRYTKAQTYNAALRYLRVDLDYEITERDPEAAYLMFRYAPPGRKATTSGAIEIVETRDAVRVYVQLPQMPAYHEQVLKDGLMKKLGDEYGEPPRATPPPEPARKDDAARKPPAKKPDAG
jgi:hypothetical protein